MRRTLFSEEHDLFRDSFRRFVETEIAPHHLEWETAGIVPRELFTTAQTLRFTVSPQDYEHREGQLHLRGRFTIAMTFKDDVTTSGQGDITFRLTDTTPLQVQTLRYTFDQ